MYEDADKTQERPAMRVTRKSSANGKAKLSKKTNAAPQRQPKRTAPNRPQRPNGSDSSAGQSSSAGQRSSAPQSRNSASHDKRRPKQGAHHSRPRKSRGVPIIIVILLILVSIAASVLITRAVMMPKIEEAQQEATVAKSQLSTLSQQLSTLSQNSEKETSTSSSAKDSTEDSKKEESDTSKSSSANGVEDPWLKSGTYTSGDSVLDTEVKAFCDSLVNTSMNLDTAALEVYKGIAWSEYVERDEAQNPSGKDWRTQFARMYYENGCSGNCYEFAAFLMYCLQYLGFDDAVAEGVLVQLQAGGWGDHGIVYVTNTDGSASICDTARGTDGWMIPQGTYNVQIQDFENA